MNLLGRIEMVRTKVTLDRTRLNKTIKNISQATINKYEEVLGEYGSRLFDELDDSITGEYYDVPERYWRLIQGRPVGPGFINIVDSGTLRNSARIDWRVTKNGTSYEFAWEAEHASEVRRGYVTLSGLIMPPRDWIGRATSVLPINPFLREAGARKLNVTRSLATRYSPNWLV